MSNIDEKAKNNFTIEMRIFENYEKVKHEIIKVIDFLRHAETNMGMCKIFDNQNHEFWHSVIKPWFKPERFGITHLWFPSGFSFIGYGEYHTIRGNRVWYQIWITQLDMNCIERYFDGYGEVKRWWLRNLQQYYVFFYEKKGGKVRGVLGKDRTKDLLRSIL